jgi:hypothetical protein
MDEIQKEKGVCCDLGVFRNLDHPFKLENYG